MVEELVALFTAEKLHPVLPLFAVKSCRDEDPRLAPLSVRFKVEITSKVNGLRAVQRHQYGRPTSYDKIHEKILSQFGIAFNDVSSFRTLAARHGVEIPVVREARGRGFAADSSPCAATIVDCADDDGDATAPAVPLTRAAKSVAERVEAIRAELGSLPPDAIATLAPDVLEVAVASPAACAALAARLEPETMAAGGLAGSGTSAVSAAEALTQEQLSTLPPDALATLAPAVLEVALASPAACAALAARIPPETMAAVFDEYVQIGWLDHQSIQICPEHKTLKFGICWAISI